MPDHEAILKNIFAFCDDKISLRLVNKRTNTLVGCDTSKFASIIIILFIFGVFLCCFDFYKV